MGDFTKNIGRRRAPAREWTPLEQAVINPESIARALELTGNAYIAPQGEQVWRNNLYTVFVNLLLVPESDWLYGGAPFVAHLSIKRNDKEPIHDWRDLQRIKNELAGTTAEAIEMYPSEERLMDEANQFHLYAFPPGVLFPVGPRERVVGDAPTSPDVPWKQRAIADHHRADGLPDIGPIWELFGLQRVQPEEQGGEHAAGSPSADAQVGKGLKKTTVEGGPGEVELVMTRINIF